MAISYIETPRDLRAFSGEEPETPTDDLELTHEGVEHLAEIFQTPLTGAYNWDYTVQDDRIKKLYELGKQLNWNVEVDIPWDATPDWQNRPSITDEQRAMVAENRKNSPFADFAPYQAMDADQVIEVGRHQHGWILSQFLHGEQGALLVASQLVSCAPSFNAKLYAASQTFDEARHVEVFNKYLQTKVGLMYPITRSLKALLDKILTDPRWDLKFIGMQIIIEGLALAAFNTIKNGTQDPVLKQIVHMVIRDEARHVTFGVNYLEEFCNQLSPEEREERARFAFEACVIMRDRLIATDVYRHFGWPVEEAYQIASGGPQRQKFRNLIFARVVPNLKRIGLLTDEIRPKFEEIGLLEFESYPDDGPTDWDELSKPLFEDEEVASV
ncbi:MAG: ferritin-like domain-containing protein [Gammaproteobacteria bacterium]|nr:ferritin-like domain-containing protein [Gammaproteobacteria bacterium]